MVKVSVVLPVYKEEEQLADATLRLIKTLETQGQSFEVILVIDGSPDDSEKIARGLAMSDKRIRVEAYATNQGKGAALLRGFKISEGEVVIFFDSDLDIHPDCLPGMIDTIVDGAADVILGSKIHKKSIVKYPLLRRVQSRIFRMIVNAAFHTHVSDTQTGAKAFRREALDKTLSSVHTQGFAHDLELIVRLNEAGMRIVEVPVVVDFQFSSSVSVSAGLQALRDVVSIFINDRKGKYRSS